MTNATAPQVIARHATTDGYSVAILLSRGAYEVVRVNDQGKFITFDWATTEPAARKIANKLWLRDMGREEMIGCGAPAI